MKRAVVCVCAGLSLLGGCSNSARPPESGQLGNPAVLTGTDAQAPRPVEDPNHPEVMATVNQLAITREQLVDRLIEAHGLNLLLYTVQLELAKERARREGLAITPQDVADERFRRLDQLLGPRISTDQIPGTDEEKRKYRLAEYERLYPKVQESLHLSETEMNMIFETGAYLWKIADKYVRPQADNKEAQQQAFDLQYGARVVVRIIKLANMREAAESQRLLQGGMKFEEVARQKSRDAESAKNGGELRPFSMAEPHWPQALKEAAFALKKPGEISDPINAGEAVYIIQLERRIAQSAVKFEDHKEIIRNQLYNAMMTIQTDQLRQFLQTEARDAIQIKDPTLRKQYVRRLEQARGEAGANLAHLRKLIGQDDRGASTRPSTKPSDSAQSGHAEVARPPATRPGL